MGNKEVFRKAYERYAKKYFKNNNNIYDGFDEKQIKLIRSYFRWRTRQYFREVTRNTSLETKPKKAETLSTLMHGATDWEYDGCVDTGYFGGGECALGHALRYEHFAYSPSLNQHLIFGITCSSDFFGCPQEQLNKIKNISMEVLEEIKIVSFLYDEYDWHVWYYENYYEDLGYILKALELSGNTEKAFGGWEKWITAFSELGIPLTEPMVSKIAMVRRWYSKDINELKRKLADFHKLTNESFYFKFVNEIIREEIIEGDEADFYLGIGEVYKRELVRHQKILNEKQLENIKNLRELCELAERWHPIDIYFTVVDNKINLVKPKNEVEAKKYREGKFYGLPEKKYRDIMVFLWGITGSEALFENWIQSSDVDNVADLESEEILRIADMSEVCSVIGNENDLVELVVSSMDKCRKAELFYKEEEKEPEKPKRVSKEVKPEQTKEQRKEEEDFIDESNLSIKRISEYVVKNYGTRNESLYDIDIGLDIAKKVFYNNLNINDKQEFHIRKAFDFMMNLRKLDTEGVVNPEIDSMVRKIVNHANDAIEEDQIISSDVNFALKVITTILHTGRCTEKQTGVLLRACNQILKADEEEQKKREAQREAQRENSNNVQRTNGNVNRYNQGVSSGTRNGYVNGVRNSFLNGTNQTTSNEAITNENLEEAFKNDPQELIPKLRVISEELGRGLFDIED